MNKQTRDAFDGSGKTATRALTFELRDEIFAIDATRVREILDVFSITDVPNAPAFARGLINVRGRVAPLADLRVAFGIEITPPNQDTRIIVLEIEIAGEPVIVGVIADKVHMVTDIDNACLEETPKVGMRWHPAYVTAIAKHDGQFIILPDLEGIFEDQMGRMAAQEPEGIR